MLDRQEFTKFFGPLAPELSGGARALAHTLERIDLCIADTQAQRTSMSPESKTRMVVLFSIRTPNTPVPLPH